MTVLIISFVIGLSVVLSYNWETRGFNSDAPVTILFGILVAAMIFIGTMYTRRGHVMLFPSKPCLSCRRLIPADSNLCPYCGTRLT